MRMRRQGPSLVVDAPAKLNLFLEVLGRRSDGYHELETVMVSIDWFDTLRFTPVEASAGETLSIRTTVQGGGALSADENNLVLRAARRLRQAVPAAGGVRMELIKRIPWQAGLGGGSSDAAATLAALNRLWGDPLTAEELHRLAAELGSDVNFFLASTPLAVCRGRGERIEPLPLRRRLPCVVVLPPGGLSTAAVFQRWTPGRTPQSVRPLVEELAARGGRLSQVRLYNALEAPASELHPGVREVLQRLRNYGLAAVGMSGSGSACFGIAESHRRARRIARQWNAEQGPRAQAASTVL